jgi:hypothetical protein
MRLAEFKTHIADRIEASIQNAETYLGRKLPRNPAFRWISPAGPLVTDSIVDEIARCAFIDEDHIYPCIDMGPLEIDPNGRLIIGGIRSGHAPGPFAKNWKGEVGPFILIFFESMRAKGD